MPAPVPMIDAMDVSLPPVTVRPNPEPVIVPALVRLIDPDEALIVVAALSVTRPA